MFVDIPVLGSMSFQEHFEFWISKINLFVIWPNDHYLLTGHGYLIMEMVIMPNQTHSAPISVGGGSWKLPICQAHGRPLQAKKECCAKEVWMSGKGSEGIFQSLETRV